MTERQLRRLEEICYRRSSELTLALEALAIEVSNILGYEVIADICNGDEIEFRTVSPGGTADAFDCIRMEDVISRLNEL